MASASVPEIKNLLELLRPVIGENTKIINKTSKFLTQPGENYGSLLISIDVIIEKTGKSAETLQLIAKLCPPNEWLRKMFATHITFKKEIKFYMEFVPSLIHFQKEHNIAEENVLNIFPRCINARVNLNSVSEIVDDDAVLLLENLKTEGYRIGNRLIGLNLEETELVLKDLARFHAVPLAFKIQKPEYFEEKLMPILNRISIGQEMFDMAGQRFIDSIVEYLDLTKTELKRFSKGMNKGFEFQKHFPVERERFATMVHCDFWLNNTMIKYSDNKAIKNKIIDFQVVTYGSAATDVVFFLYTSVIQDVLDKYYDHFIKVYYAEFIKTLLDLHCDITDFNLDSFINEIEFYGPLEASHVIVMFKAVFADSEHVKNMEDFKFEDMFKKEGVTDEYQTRLSYTVRKFLDKNWF